MKRIIYKYSNNILCKILNYAIHLSVDISRYQLTNKKSDVDDYINCVLSESIASCLPSQAIIAKHIICPIVDVIP